MSNSTNTEEMTEEHRLEYLRGELRAERISWGELAELQGLAEHIKPGDVELLEAAGVPEFAEDTNRFIVIESTPGYLPDADEPAEFDNYADAVAYANELADELEEQGYECDRSWASSQNTYAISCTTSEKIHDLGRTIEVVQEES